VFDDDTFTTLRAKMYGDDPEIEPDILDRSSFGYEELIRAGIMTEEEVTALRAEKEARAQAYAERRERETYERLKRKFG